MPNLRSGAKYKVAPEHHGRFAHRNGVFSTNKKRQQEELLGAGRSTRFQTIQEDERQKRIRVTDPSPPTPTKEKLVVLERPTRSSKPTCLHYSVDKKFFEMQYPNHFYCGRCEAYVEAMLLSTNKNAIKRDSRHYSCQGGHKSFISPSTLKIEKMNRHLFKTVLEESETESDDAESVAAPHRIRTAINTPASRTIGTAAAAAVIDTPLIARAVATPSPNQNPAAPPADPLRNLQADYDRLSGVNLRTANDFQELQELYSGLLLEVQEQKKQAEQHQVRYTNLLGRHQSLLLKVSNPKDLVARAMNLPFEDVGEFDGSDVVSQAGKKRKNRVAKFVALTLMQSSFYDGLVREEILKQAKTYFREEVYSPWKIARCMDRHGGKISLQSIDILRTIETENKKYVQNTILCSSATIRRAAAIVNQFANGFVPFTSYPCPPELGGGEVIEFDTKQVIEVVLRSTDLKTQAMVWRIEIPQSADSTVVSTNLSFLIYGIKIVDKAAVCPLSKRPLWMRTSEGHLERSLIQSWENCIPVKIVMGKETKELVSWALEKNFRELEKETNLNDDDHSSILGEGYKPLKSPCDADKKMQWIGLGTGGGAKVYKKPCTCCAVESKFLSTPNTRLCARWCLHWQQEGKLVDYPNWQCFHKDMITPEKIAELTEQSTELQQEFAGLTARFDSIWAGSLIDIRQDPRGDAQANWKRDHKSIFYDFEQANDSERNAYMARVANDIVIRDLELTGSLSAMRDTLKAALAKEFTLREIQEDISWGTINLRTAFYLVINAVPCILHMENRVGLKILTRLLRLGLDNWVAGVCGEGSCESARMKNFIEKIEGICSYSIWGREDRPVTWRCPYDAEQKAVGKLCLDNVRTRSAIASLELLIDVCVVPEQRDLWKTTIGYYEASLKILLKREDLTMDEVYSFQWEIDRFAQDWVKLNKGNEGATNYIHDLQSGHIADYLIHWRNLYVHSQQGWEALNFAVKKYWFRCTNRGGGRGSGNRLEPMAKWFQRRLVWMTGIPFAEMLAKVKSGEEFNIEDLDEMDML